MSRPIPERLQFFLDRIGKTLFRNDNGCSCDICALILEKGIYIHDAFQAEYCYDTECDYNRDGTPLRYFDTPGEVENWLKTIQKC